MTQAQHEPVPSRKTVLADGRFDDHPRDARSGPPLPPVVFTGFVAAFVAILLITLLSFEALQVRRQNAEQVLRTLETTQLLQQFLSTVKDAETGQRGFLLTGEESYLQPYTRALAEYRPQMESLRAMADARQLAQIDRLEILAVDKLRELNESIQLRRANKLDDALLLIRSDRGRILMDNIRTLAAEMERAQNTLLAEQQRQWNSAINLTSIATWGGCVVLLVLVVAAAIVTSRNYRAQRIEAWLRGGQMQLGLRLQGAQGIDTLAGRALDFLADYLDTPVGALYVGQNDGSFHRVAGYAVATGRDSPVRPGDGLLGQAALSRRPVRVDDVPAGYLPISSALGTGDSRTLLIAPALADGEVHAVLELGFLHHVHPEVEELLARVSESLGIAVRAARDRSRLEELLAKTQSQSEELQVQQEELRVNNEELEEQSRALKESQVQLESQQAELEQINSQLEEHMQLLGHQKDELQRSQQSLTVKADELARANQYKSEFLANMSHELRTPLNSSLIFAKLLADNKERNLTGEQVRFAQAIWSAGNDLLALINDILDLAKIESGKVEVDIAPLHVGLAVDDLIKSFQPLAEQRHLGLRAEVVPEAPLRISTDHQRLRQILKNLVSNALKFTETGEVVVRIFPVDAERIAFAVVDTGIGIADTQQEIIFEAFRQADGSTHRKYGGTGLGLSISRDLAHLLGGDLTVRSEVGGGSVFTLTIPIALTPETVVAAPLAPAPAPLAVRPQAALPAAAAPFAEARTPGARTILVIEDDVEFARILHDVARESGFQCLLRHTAHEGLEAAREYQPSGILLDMKLPDQHGLGVLEELKRDPHTRHIPVHVLSVEDHSQEALGRGAVGYALKPAQRDQLVVALQRLEAKLSQSLRRVLVVEDDARQLDSIRQLLQNGEVEITGVDTAGAALAQLQATTFDCMVMDLNLPDISGYELLQCMAEQDDVSFPPVIVYTGRSLTRDEEQQLRRFSKSIIIKDARSPERLLDEVTLFLHQVESTLPLDRQRMLKAARHREAAFENRRILVVEDDARNIFALSSILEPRGAKVEVARNGREAIERLANEPQDANGPFDLVLMDIMMPEMDGFTAMQEIRKRAEWRKLPIIALTAKAMKDDQEKCLAAGANDYIAKPLDVDKLLSLMRVWMPK